MVLCHQNLVHGIMAISNTIQIRKDDLYVALLPLAHALEQAMEDWLGLACGIPIGYSSPFTLTDRSSSIKDGHQGDVSVLRPSIVTTVPLMLERIFKGIQENIDNGPAIKRNLFNFALQYKLHWTEKGYDTPIINAQVFFHSLKSFLLHFKYHFDYADFFLRKFGLFLEVAFVSSFPEDRLWHQGLSASWERISVVPLSKGRYQHYFISLIILFRMIRIGTD